VPSYPELREQLKQHLTAVKSIAAAADAAGRDLTPAERSTVDTHMKSARELRPRVETARIDDEVKGAIRAFGDEIGLPAGAPSSAGGGYGGGSAAAAVPAWAAKSAHSAWVSTTMERYSKAAAAGGAKALLSGSLDVPAPVDVEITRMAEYPTRVLDLLIDRRPIENSNTYSYARQSVRTNNAAPVADATAKPVSIFTVTDVEDRVRVLAHLSENVPERVLADHGELADFLEVEMERGLMQALETQVVAGSGVGENMTGILNTSGILTQAWNTNMYTTLRKARTTMSGTGEQPTAWLLNPSDTEAIDLLREGADGGFLLATPPGNILGSLPVVESTAVPAGVGLLGDWRWARLMVRQEATLDVDRSGTLFDTNQVRFRLEGRYGLAVRRTTAFCSVDLTAL
jgi:HK97 family phage major capsid protein